jgi:hypothetical protein
MTNILTYWLLLVLGMVALGIGLAFVLVGNWPGAGAMFTLCLVLVLLVVVTRKDKRP